MNPHIPPLPRYRPMLATPAPATGRWAEWAEIKWDGYRCLAYVTERETRLFSRGGKDLTPFFPELRGLQEWISCCPCVLDGEIIVLVGGRPSFSHLQQRTGMHAAGLKALAAAPPPRRVPAVFIAFDLLHVGRDSLIAEPLHQRRRRLEDLVHPAAAIQLSQIYQAPVDRLLDKATDLGLEGLVVKDPASPYVPGRRTRYWLKFKHRRTMVAVIVGFTQHGDALRALLIASASGEGEPRIQGEKAGGASLGSRNDLQFLGRVGTGFSDVQRRRLLQRLRPLRRAHAPLAEIPPDVPEDATWVEPVLRCRVAYLEITPAGRLRQPSFLELVE